MNIEESIKNASSLLKQKKYLESLNAFNKVIEIEPDNHKVWCKKVLS